MENGSNDVGVDTLSNFLFGDIHNRVFSTLLSPTTKQVASEVPLQQHHSILNQNDDFFNLVWRPNAVITSAIFTLYEREPQLGLTSSLTTSTTK